MTHAPLIGDFQRRRLALAAARERASGLSRAIWMLVGALSLTIIVATIVLLRADQRGSDISDARAQVLDAREALSVAAQSFREAEELNDTFFNTRNAVLDSLVQARLDEPMVGRVRSAFEGLEAERGATLSKDAVGEFSLAAEIASDRLATASASLQRELEDVRRRLLVEGRACWCCSRSRASRARSTSCAAP
jgi:hypothetical protein